MADSALTNKILSIVLAFCLRQQGAPTNNPRKPNTAAKPTATQTPKNQDQPPPSVASLEGSLASVFDSQTINGDYIPCEFSIPELLQLRPNPQVTVINSYYEEQLRSAVLSQALSKSNASVFPKRDQREKFAMLLADTPLEGLTMSQALAVVIALLNQATALSNEAQIVADSTQGGHKQFVEVVSKRYGLDEELLGRAVTSDNPRDMMLQAQVAAGTRSKPQNEQPSKGKPSAGSASATFPSQATGEAAISEALQSFDQGQSKESIVDSARKTLSAFQRPNDVGCAMSILSWNSVRYAFGETLANEYIAVQVVVRNMNSQQEFLVHDAEVAVDADMDGAHARYSSGLDKLTVRGFMLASRDYGRRNLVVNLAQGVGTILSATTTVFGGGVASAAGVYNAGFLNALNGTWKDHNTEQLNLLNDVGFSASKTDRTVVPKSGTAMFVVFIPSKQFESGWWTQDCANVIVTSKERSPKEEKKPDRGAGQPGPDKTPSPGSGSPPVPPPAAEPGASIGSPDPNSTNSPGPDSAPAGTVMAQDAKSGQSSSQSDSGKISPSTPPLAPAAGVDPQEAYKNLVKFQRESVGVDLEAARAICQQYYGQSTQKPSHSDSSDDNNNPIVTPQTSSGSVTTDRIKVNYLKAPQTVPYRKWSSTSYSIFRELAFTVVAGSHFLESKDTTPILARIDCPADSQGNIDFTKISNGVIACDLTGTNLDKAAKIKLRNSQDATDTTTADGSVSTSGDSTNAKVSFPADSLGALNHKLYKAWCVTKDGTESCGTSPPIHLDLEPFLTAAPTPDVVRLDQLTGKDAKPVQVSLTGYHLDKLNTVHLGGSEKVVAPGDQVSIEAQIKAGASASKATFDFTPANAATLPPGDYTSTKLSIYIFLESKDTPNTQKATLRILYFSGDTQKKTPTSAPKQPAATPKIILSLSPVSATVGKPVSLTITVNDAAGKVNTAYAGLVHFTVSDKQASPLADFTFKPEDKGTKTLPVTFNSPGTQTITVTSDKLTAKKTITVK